MSTRLEYDKPEDEYHADRDSLSASGMKLLLKAPALFKHAQQNREKPKTAYDIGNAVHGKVLGTGWPLVVVDADSWQTKAAKQQRDEARAAGKVPVLKAQAEAADTAAEAVLAHPIARKLLTGGHSEVSAYWHDETWGITRRARFDHLTDRAIGDLKTTTDASPDHIARAVVRFSYDMAAAQYVDVAAGNGLGDLPFALVFVEVDPPHLVTVCELSSDFLARGRRLAAEALERYRDCTASGVWPGYTTEPFLTIHPPRWAD